MQTLLNYWTTQSSTSSFTLKIRQNSRRVKIYVYVLFESNFTAQELPEIYCIGDLTMPAAIGKSYATVTYPEPSTVNAASYTCWPASGTNFNIGDTIVTCQAWRNGASEVCNFNVNVRGMKISQFNCTRQSLQHFLKVTV